MLKFSPADRSGPELPSVSRGPTSLCECPLLHSLSVFPSSLLSLQGPQPREIPREAVVTEHLWSFFQGQKCRSLKWRRKTHEGKPTPGAFSATFPNKESSGHLKFTMALKKSQHPVIGCLPEGLSPPPWTSPELSFLLGGGRLAVSLSQGFWAPVVSTCLATPSHQRPSSNPPREGHPKQARRGRQWGPRYGRDRGGVWQSHLLWSQKSPTPPAGIAGEPVARRGLCLGKKDATLGGRCKNNRDCGSNRVPNPSIASHLPCSTPSPPPFPLGELHPIQAVSCRCWSKTSILSPLLLSRGTVPASLHSGN